ncbi:hypothetical protein AURDEDRAFT_174106 [Auricularia subglabra TFB-10046 SS5]|nr:hypothetical protein AURDEDRAFT_174106 [Auricularia subglabra TFB-10046 SS5]
MKQMMRAMARATLARGDFNTTAARISAAFGHGSAVVFDATDYIGGGVHVSRYVSRFWHAPLRLNMLYGISAAIAALPPVESAIARAASSHSLP